MNRFFFFLTNAKHTVIFYSLTTVEQCRRIDRTGKFQAVGAEVMRVLVKGMANTGYKEMIKVSETRNEIVSGTTRWD
jgi:hypothetical protein